MSTDLKLRTIAKCATVTNAGGRCATPWERERLRFVSVRRALGMTQTEAADHLGVSVESIGRWESTGEKRTALPAWAMRALLDLAGAESERRTG